MPVGQEADGRQGDLRHQRRIGQHWLKNRHGGRNGQPSAASRASRALAFRLRNGLAIFMIATCMLVCGMPFMRLAWLRFRKVGGLLVMASGAKQHRHSRKALHRKGQGQETSQDNAHASKHVFSIGQPSKRLHCINYSIIIELWKNKTL
ncbi:MAG: hypothetical protein EOP38_19185 [Rubrivivax sp.]|nr:MAG: hypothetical protein EOP38_19185 [Rubrivivax sp.]